MTRWGNRVLLFLNIVLLLGSILYFGTHPLHKSDDGIEYKDLISIILSVLAVILGALTIFVAVLAIWGYNSIREESFRAAGVAAEATARKVAEEVTPREVLRMWKAMGLGKPGEENELASALQSGDGSGEVGGEPHRDPGEAH